MGFKRPEVQIFSLRPKNSRKQLRLFLFSLSEKFSFRRPEMTRFPYFIFTHCRFRFFRFTYSVLSRGKTLFRRGFFLLTVLFISRKRRRSLQIFSLRPKNSRMQLRLFLFSLSEKFSFRRPERTRFPYFIFTRLYFRFSLLLTRFCRGAKRYSVAAFILRSYLFSRNSRRSLQIFSLRPKNSRMQLRLFLFRLSEKFSFRRPEMTRFPYFIFTRLYFRFSLLLTRSYRGAKRYSVAAFYFTVLLLSRKIFIVSRRELQIQVWLLQKE